MKKNLGFKLLSALLSASMIFGLTACSGKSDGKAENANSAEAIETSIGILQLVEHEALDATKNGFIDSLKEEGLKEGENLYLDFQNAQNDQSNLKTMSQKFVNDGVDLIFTIATPAALSVAAETKDIPIVCSAITDYVACGLIESNEKPGGNVTGTSDLTPVKEQINLLHELFPDAKSVGVMYNSGEANSEVQAKMAEEACKELGITCVKGTVTSVNDIQQVITNIIEDVDAIYVPTDNTVASAMPLVTSVANGAKIPVICGEKGHISSGGLVSVGIDYYRLGFQTGKMAKKILDGANPADMPIEYLDTTDLCINLDAAKEIGFQFPEKYINDAVYVFENGQMTKK